MVGADSTQASIALRMCRSWNISNIGDSRPLGLHHLRFNIATSAAMNITTRHKTANRTEKPEITETTKRTAAAPMINLIIQQHRNAGSARQAHAAARPIPHLAIDHLEVVTAPTIEVAYSTVSYTVTWSSG
jgi:hypothetical protein